MKYMEVPIKAVRGIMDELTYTNPYIDFEEAMLTGQKRKAGKSSHEDEADRGREPGHAEAIKDRGRRRETSRTIAAV